MRTVLTMLFCALSSCVLSQTSIQISGQIIRPPSDTITVECFSDGNTIDRDVFVGQFYNFTIGERPHYTLKFTSGQKVKYCYIICNMMGVEKIIVDVDFASEFNAIIYLEKKNNKYFSMMLYDRYRTRNSETIRRFSQY